MDNRVVRLINTYLVQLKNGLFHMLSANVINKVIGMICNMLITRFMTKGEYGTWSYILNIYSYFGLVTGLGLYSGALQFGAENRGNEKEYSYFQYALEKGLAIDTVIVIAFILSSFFIRFSIPEAEVYLRLYVPILILEYALNLFQFLIRCQDKIKEYALQLNINSVISSIGICIGAVFGVSGIIIGKYLAVIISLAVLMLRIKPDLRKMKKSAELMADDIAQMWKYSLSTGASAALNGILYLLDLSMIAALIKDPADVGTYKVATLLPTALTFIPTSVVVSIATKIIYHRDDKLWLKKSLKKTFFGLGLFNMAIVSVMVIFAPLVISVLSGEQYLASVPAFRVLAVGYLISGTFRSLSVNVLASLKQTVSNLIISITSVASDIILNLLLITRFQSMGAAYATFFTEIITSVMGFMFLCFYIHRMQEK